MSAACSICFLNTINYIEVQNYFFGINGLSDLGRLVAAFVCLLFFLANFRAMNPRLQTERMMTNGGGGGGREDATKEGHRHAQAPDYFNLSDILSLHPTHHSPPPPPRGPPPNKS